jgi:hypothetical protein
LATSIHAQNLKRALDGDESGNPIYIDPPREYAGFWAKTPVI